MKLLALTVLAVSGVAQVYPTAVATDADLLVARNRSRTTLNGSINASTSTIVLTSGALFGNNMVITIDSEDIFCTTLTSNTFTGCTRGYGGSTAATHSSLSNVTGNIVANHHNVLKNEVKAVETALGANGSNIPALAGLYKFSCTTPADVTCTFYDDTAITGVTQLYVRAGAAQATQLVRFIDNMGTLVSGVDADASLFSSDTNGRQIVVTPSTLGLASAIPISWRSANNWDSGSIDVSILRNGTGSVEFNNGTATHFYDTSIKAGGATFYNNKPSTGITAVAFRNGAGQSTNALLTFRDPSNVVQGQIGPQGDYGAYDPMSSKLKVDIGYYGDYRASDGSRCWNSGDDLNSLSVDACLSRNAAGVVEFNNGTPGTYRDAKLRTLQVTTKAEATCDSTTRGTFDFTAGSAGVADSVRVCAKDSSDTYAWVPIF